MKKLIDRFLDWLKIKPKTKPQEEVAAWPFPEETLEPKKKPAVKKATTRKPAVKKPAVKKAK